MADTMILEGGKYTITNDRGLVDVRRYGDTWRTNAYLGDKCFGALFDKAVRLRAALELAQNALMGAADTPQGQTMVESAEVYKVIEEALRN